MTYQKIKINGGKNEQNKKEEQEYANAKPDTQIKDNEEDIKKAQKQALKEKARAKIKEEDGKCSLQCF